jgi:hypothetical protein
MRKYACLLLLIISCSHVSAPPTASSSQNQAAASRAPRTAALFDFHSSFWVNLHQVLLHEALLRVGKPDRRLQSTMPLSAMGMTDADKAAWNAAIDSYANEFQGKKELFDDTMVEINDRLAQEADDGASLDASGLPPAVADTLRAAAPVYRKYWWSAHKKSNEDWIASQTARVRDLGPKIAVAITKDLQQSWPEAPIRVDVCYYVPEIGYAYTTAPPAHTTLSSIDTQAQGLNGFEILFHEASHSFADAMTNALHAECSKQKKDCGQLWHAVLFYTAGVEVRRALPAADQANFTPYAYEYGLYTRGDWPKYPAVLEADWQKYLDGKISFADAIHSMVADLR